MRFYDESLSLYRDLSNDFGYNIMYSERGHFTLAHTDAAIRTSRWRAEVNKHLGVDSELIFTDEIRRLCPSMNLSEDVRYPVLGALYHPPGAIARHDAVAWGYAEGRHDAGRGDSHAHRGHGHPHREREAAGVETNRGTVYCNRAMQAVAGSSSLVAKLAGFRLPIRTIPLQACVSVPLKPFLDQIVVSGSLHIYISQTPRGELVMGGSTDPYALYSTRSTLDFKEGLLGHMLELFPFLDNVTVLRQWAGMADMTPDFSPVMGLTPVENYYIDSGWGTWGFKATPVCGKRMAETVATGKVPDILRALPPRPLRRFRPGRRKRRGVGGALSCKHEDPELPAERPAQHLRIRLGRRGEADAGSGAGSDRDWGAFVFLENNTAGVVREWWCHVPTSFWFIAERNTVTDEIIRTYPAGELFNERVEFAAKLKAGERTR